MDSSNITFDEFLNRKDWDPNEEWLTIMQHDDLMEKLDSMARNIDMYRQLLDTAITDHRKEIIVKCQVRWMHRYIKLAEIIF